MSHWPPLRPKPQRLITMKDLFAVKPGSWRLALLLAIAVFLIPALIQPKAVAGALFQSPQSPPPSQPAEAPPPAPTATPPPPPTAAPPPSEPVQTTSESEAPIEEPSPTPTQVLPEPAATEPVPVEAAAPTEELLPTQPVESAGAQPAGPLPQPVDVRRDDSQVQPEEGGDPNFVLDQAELIDTVAISGAYVWLCCGIGLLLVAPLFFTVLYVRGRSKIIREEGF